MPTIKQQIQAAMGQELPAVEQALADHLEPHYELVREIAGHLLFAGGKRLRPLLMLLCARLCGKDDPGAMRLCVVFEYLHAATLLHDDILDGATTRRGKAAAHTVYGVPETILTGDFLLARTCSIATQTGILPVIQTITDVAGAMSEGEIRQMELAGNPRITLDQYLDVIERKTAVLLSAACKVGALYAGAGEQQIQDLAEFGRRLGLAFQIADDLLDFTGDPVAMGKPRGSDIAEGKTTLPLILAKEKASPEELAVLDEIIAKKSASPEDFDRVLAVVKKTGGLEAALDQARQEIKTALDLLEPFADGPEKDLLKKICLYVTDRES